MDKEIKDKFRAAVKALIEAEDIDTSSTHILSFPRTFLLSIVGLLGGRLNPGQIQELEEELPAVLAEFNIKIVSKRFLKGIEKRKQAKKKREIAKMMRGARGADFRHRKVLGDDY
jgi:hypothetical protein